MSGWFVRRYRYVYAKALKHNVNPLVFILLYALSFLPYYVGVYLMLRGVLSSVSWGNLFDFDFGQLTWGSPFVIWGLLVNRLGWALPYLYVQVMGRGLRWYVHTMIAFWLLGSVGYAIYQILGR